MRPFPSQAGETKETGPDEVEEFACLAQWQCLCSPCFGFQEVSDTSAPYQLECAELAFFFATALMSE